MQVIRRLINKGFGGVNISAPLERLAPEFFQQDLNGDRRPRRAWRPRRGYSRFLSGDVVPTFTAEYTDNFNLSDQQRLGANWSGGYFGCDNPCFQIKTSQVQPYLGFGVLAGASYTAAVFGDDHASQITVVNIGNASDSTPGVGVRFTSVGGYYMGIDGNNTTLRLYSITDWGTCTFGSAAVVILDTYSTVDFGGYPIVRAGDTMRLHVNGSTLRGFVNNTLLLMASSTVHGSGAPGIVYNMGAITATPWRLDDWGGGASVFGVENVQVDSRPSKLLAFERGDDTVQICAAYGDGVTAEKVEAFNTGVPEGL